MIAWTGFWLMNRVKSIPREVYVRMYIIEMSIEKSEFLVFIIHLYQSDFLELGKVAIKQLLFSCFKVYFYDFFPWKALKLIVSYHGFYEIFRFNELITGLSKLPLESCQPKIISHVLIWRTLLGNGWSRKWLLLK